MNKPYETRKLMRKVMETIEDMGTTTEAARFVVLRKRLERLNRKLVAILGREVTLEQIRDAVYGGQK